MGHRHPIDPTASARSRRYWEDKQHMYPYQIEVEQFTAADLDPRTFARDISMDFLRVPFDGIAHWGFRYPQTLEKFMSITGLR